MFVTLSKINGSLSDITRQTKKLGQDDIELSFNSGDAIYLGSKLKFNHAYISSTVNAVSSVPLEVTVWDGSEFTSVARAIDSTDGLTQSGVLEFTPKSEKSWSNADSEDISEISSIAYYGLYWTRIELGSTDSITIDLIGHKFSNDFDLFSEHPELNNASFLSYFNQSDFEKQAVLAGELIEKRLIKIGYAEGNEQLLQWEDLTLASVSKTAQLIYTSFGNTYTDNVSTLAGEFSSRIGESFPIIDKNNNAIKDDNKKVTQGLLYR